MSKHVILVTGTPCVGKTSVAHLLTARLDAIYVNLTELATRENLTLGKDEERDSIIVDEERMRVRLGKIIQKAGKDVIVDGHYAVNVVPEELVTWAFVLRRDPVELRKFMQNCGFSEKKMLENLASEILDVCLFDALNVYDGRKTCELDITGKKVEETVDEILSVMVGQNSCSVGIVDWLGKLEGEGLLDEYLKT